MDGYIKSKQNQIKLAKRAIMAKYSVTILFLVVLIVPHIIFLEPAPAEWKQEVITISNIQKERLGIRRFQDDVVVTSKGEKFALPALSAEQKEALIIGGQYTITYASVCFVNNIVGMTKDTTVLIDTDSAVASWEQDQIVAHRIIAIVFILEVIALVLIDRCWCKPEYTQIRKLKQDIIRRQGRITKKQ